MSKLTWTQNEVTGQLQANFNAKLVSVGEKVLPNSNGKEYVLCNIQLESGKTISGRMYTANVAKLDPETIGMSVLCTATQYGENQLDITVSHLTSAPRISANEFEAEFGAVSVKEAAAKVN
jgi:hypothetical protein